MLKNNTQQDIYEEYDKCEEDVEFDWKDIIAFIIATFQVLLPYVLILGGCVFVIMILFTFIMN